MQRDVDLEFGAAPTTSIHVDIAYADDTALVSNNIQRLQFTLDRLIVRAAMYGLTLNWDKTVHLQVRHAQDIHTPSGTALKTVASAVYLGSLLCADGKTGSSIARRIGEARGSFTALQSVWKHANISRHRKTHLFNACVVSKLTYSLEMLCLRKADRDRVDAFQVQCLRKIHGIPHSMISHVSNDEVREQARQTRLSQQIFEKQLLYYGKNLRLPDSAVTRNIVFQKGSTQLVAYDKRARGRPRLEWATVLRAHVVTMTEHAELDQLLHPQIWRSLVRPYCAH